MGLFKPAASTQAKAKIGIYGGTGSGKTWTAALIALGIRALIKSKKPVYFFDTETGSDFVHESLFKKHNVPLMQLKSRAFNDLLDAVREAEKGGAVLIADSVTHVWEEFKRAYLKKTNQKFIQLWDWAKLKETWGEFTDLFINSDLHIIICGREASIYEQVEEKQGNNVKKTAQKVGTKMKSESEQGYEPSLLLQMEKVHLLNGEKDGRYARRCHVIKDRFNVVDSKDFDDPTFENFRPHIKLLNLGGQQLGVDTERTSDANLFDGNGDGERQKRARRRTILCEEIQGLLTHYFPNTNAKEKKIKADIIFEVFKTRSWSAIESDWVNVPLAELEKVMKNEKNAPCPLEQTCIKENEKLTVAKE